ncbi:hypothetical protein BDK51DRAFT_39006 [Blyttiomyces helicus]|uniref:Uncharacterized protein n=1 Tax=Blyttiomyces helicus TaxID=388810 RepID=A0A4P9W3L3_9FUNG|nr:hypothetical protein BDK51DRAFT_39006 [Blyttiomyces helicus]|eukprot:RKO86911.1 hypothetical protein BDK51DRAFT_39006 [Blyttiomyces helicus]
MAGEGHGGLPRPCYNVQPFPNPHKILEQLQKKTKNKAKNPNNLAGRRPPSQWSIGPLHLPDKPGQETSLAAIPANPAAMSAPPGLPQNPNGVAAVRHIILVRVLDDPNENRQGRKIQDKVNRPSSSDELVTGAETAENAEPGATGGPAPSNHSKHLLDKLSIRCPKKYLAKRYKCRFSVDANKTPVEWINLPDYSGSKMVSPPKGGCSRPTRRCNLPKGIDPTPAPAPASATAKALLSQKKQTTLGSIKQLFRKQTTQAATRMKETITPEQSKFAIIIQTKSKPKRWPRTQAANNATANEENITPVLLASASAVELQPAVAVVEAPAAKQDQTAPRQETCDRPIRAVLLKGAVSVPVKRTRTMCATVAVMKGTNSYAGAGIGVSNTRIPLTDGPQFIYEAAVAPKKFTGPQHIFWVPGFE